MPNLLYAEFLIEIDDFSNAIFLIPIITYSFSQLLLSIDYQVSHFFNKFIITFRKARTLIVEQRVSCNVV